MRERTIIFLFALLIGTFLQAQVSTKVEPIQEVGSEHKVTAFTLDKDNNKYVGTNKGLVKVSSNGAVETLYSGGAVQSVVWHKQEGVWIGIEGNKLYQPSTGTQIELEGENVHINAMALSGSQIWVGTNNGVYVVSTQKNKVMEHHTVENSKMENNVVNDIFIDDSRLKWIATDGGVLRIDNKKWKLYEKEIRIQAITGNSEGTWIAGDGEMWLVDTYNRWAPTGVTDGLSAGAVRALAADKKGRIYILSDILVQFDPYTDVHTEIDNQYTLQTGSDVALLCDMDDKLWVGSLEHGLVAMEVQIVAVEGQELIAFIKVKHPDCTGQASGTLDVTAQGGTPPYQYSWSNATLSGNSLAVLKPGKYEVTITDAENNSYLLEATLDEPLEMAVSFNVDESNGVVEAMPSGGAGGYIYSWSNGGASKSLSDLPAGSYTLEVSDNAGCTVSAVHVQKAIAVAEPVVEPTVEPVIEPIVVAVAVSAATIDAVDSDVLKVLDAKTLAVGQTLRIEQLNFDADSTNINAQSTEVLDEVYSFLNSNDRIVIEIGGHTNGLPEHDYCDQLSTSRAQSVAEYLYDKGISEGRVVYKGYGKRDPIATNSTVAGRRKNQRVEIKILEI